MYIKNGKVGNRDVFPCGFRDYRLLERVKGESIGLAKEKAPSQLTRKICLHGNSSHFNAHMIPLH